MSKSKFTRQGKKITIVETGKTEIHDSINQAKRASHKLQIRDQGSLGLGCLINV